MLRTVYCCLAIIPSTAERLVGQSNSVVTPAAIEESIDYADQLPRIPPQPPEQALRAFQVADGFRIELVAAEPLVTDPVAFAFDARQRLWVVEMRGYSERPDAHLGRIAVLEDRDQDGRMDYRKTFVEGLSWPTGIWPCHDGVLVAHAPYLTFYRDSDGDGQSDVAEHWFEGFGRQNVQGMVNSLRWGVDGYLHGATSTTGARLRGAHQPGADPLNLRGRDFRVDTLKQTITPVSGGGQHGLSFNRWGDRFVTSNSDHLQQVIDLEQWLGRVAESTVELPRLRRSIAADGPQAEVFRTSPIEPWRIVRTRLRVGGLVSGPVEGGGRPAGYFTGATGTCILDPAANFGPAGYDTALVGDVGGNLVHRKRLIDQGLYWRGERIDDQNELLTSTDTWFRPVQLGDGPDGSLYIADMYREVIEHPKSLPPMIKRHLDLNSGWDRGRIWRLSPASRDLAPAAKVLADLTTEELVRELASSNAWRRRMASQLLVEAADPRLLGTQLRHAIRSSDAPVARVLAAHIAFRHQLLEPGLLRTLLSDSHSRVREHALRLTRLAGLAAQVGDQLDALDVSSEPRIQLAAAQLCAELESGPKQRLARRVFAAAKDPLVCAVLARSLGVQLVPVMKGVDDEMPDTQYAMWLQLVIREWAQVAEQNTDLTVWIREQLSDREQPRQSLWLDALSELQRESGLSSILSGLSPLQRQSVTQSVSSTLARSDGFDRWRRVKLLPEEQQVQLLSDWLKPGRETRWQQAAISLVEDTQRPALVDVLQSSLGLLDRQQMQRALRVLASTNSGALSVLEATQRGELSLELFSADLRERLRGSQAAQVAALSKQLFPPIDQDRTAVIDAYASALDETAQGDSERLQRGAQQFKRVCAQCHRLSGLGQDVGAPLTDLASKSPAQLLSSILDPNREVDPRYVSYSLLLDDDRVLTGVIRSESVTHIHLVEAGGREHQVQRSRVVQLSSSGNSLMPSGLESQLTPGQMSELIGYLRSIR